MTFEGQRGQVLPLVAVCCAMLLGFGSLAVDAGYMRFEQRIQQSATDAAAISGAAQLAYGSSGVNTAASNAATTNGFTNGSNVTVTITSPPDSGPYSGNSQAVRVVITVGHAPFLGGVFGLSREYVTTEATGLFNPHVGPACIYVLQNSSSTPLNGSQLYGPNCGIIVNNAWTANGSNINFDSIEVAGQITSNGTTYASATPAPSIQTADPCMQIIGCAYLKTWPPATTPCNYTNYTSNGGSSVWLNPGVYCGNTTFNGTANVNFNSGLYVFTGAITSNGVQNFNGTAVTFYFTTTDNVTFNGSSASLSAPTSGNTAGMLFYAPNAQGATVNGGPGKLSGVLYFPRANTTFNGTSSSYFVLVTGTLTFNGSVSDPGPGPGGSFVGAAVLAG